MTMTGKAMLTCQSGLAVATTFKRISILSCFDHFLAACFPVFFGEAGGFLGEVGGQGLVSGLTSISAAEAAVVGILGMMMVRARFGRLNKRLQQGEESRGVTSVLSRGTVYNQDSSASSRAFSTNCIHSATPIQIHRRSRCYRRIRPQRRVRGSSNHGNGKRLVMATRVCAKYSWGVDKPCRRGLI